MGILKTRNNSQETLSAVEQAIVLADKTDFSSAGIEELGRGWVAEEALAMGIYGAIMAKDDFKRGVLLSVNHSGDSDSTGSIAGNILGALHGLDHIPENWRKGLELNDLIQEIAGDLFDQFG